MLYIDEMKKKLISIALCALLAVSCVLPFGTAARADEDDAGLCFGEDGTFTVLILSDLQETQFTTDLVLQCEAAVLADYPADLIVLLGDQLEGASPVLRLGNGADNCEDTIRAVLEPVAESGIPFAVVFGNHDFEAPLSVAEQAKIYESYDTCIGVCYGSGEPDCGAFSLPVLSSDGSSDALELYFFDSGSYIANGDYDTVSAEQVIWYNDQSAALYDENSSQTVPAVAFFHIPLPEVYELFTEVDKGTEGAFEGVGVGKGKYYLPNEDMIFAGEVNEAPCPSSENNGLFDAFCENGDVFLAVNGHDHVNSYIGYLDGVDLANAPGSSFTSYGDKDVRGVRLFRFTEYDVKNYEMLHVLYSDYVTPASYGYLRYYFTATTGIPNAAKVLILLVVLVAALVVTAVVLLKKRKRKRRSAEKAAVPDVKTPPSETAAPEQETTPKQE